MKGNLKGWPYASFNFARVCSIVSHKGVDEKAHNAYDVC